ncbi:MAG: nicotinate-nucleotide adenylyltransferase [Alphaproteobacteria bacterium]
MSAPVNREILYPGMRVGLLGGSFNPAHAGHRHISLIALKRLQLDRVWWLVSSQNPLKPVRGMASLPDRVKSANAIAGHPRIVVSTIEKRLRTAYTRDTLAALRQRWPGVHFVWLMGADNLAQLPRWRNWNQIMRLMPVAVLDRPGSGIRVLHGKAALRYAYARIPLAAAPRLVTQSAPAWIFIPCRLHPASSTAIRAERSS